MKRVNRFNTGRFCRRLLGCGLVVGLSLLAGSGCGQKGKIDSNRYTALGEVMAGKTIELCGGKGTIVLVISESDKDKPTASGQTIAAFRKALGKAVPVAAIESVKTPAMIMRGIEPLPAAKFAELLQKYSTADYLVSFVGVPLLTPDQIAQLPTPRPQVVVAVVHNAPARAMFAQKVICLAAIPKVASDVAAANSPQELFDAQYQLITPETAGLLPN